MASEERSEFTLRIGRVLRIAREQKALTQADVAAALRVDRSTVTAWETGKRLPDYPTLQSLMQLLGIPPEQLAMNALRQTPEEPSPEDRLRAAGAQLRAAGVRDRTVRLLLALARQELRGKPAEPQGWQGEEEP